MTGSLRPLRPAFFELICIARRLDTGLFFIESLQALLNLLEDTGFCLIEVFWCNVLRSHTVGRGHVFSRISENETLANALSSTIVKMKTITLSMFSHLLSCVRGLVYNLRQMDTEKV